MVGGEWRMGRERVPEEAHSPFIIRYSLFTTDHLPDTLRTPISIAPLVSLRVAFGVLMCASLLRFQWNSWVDKLFVLPAWHFTYFGFEWVKPLSASGMHAVFAVMTASTVLIALGLCYRVATVLFFLLFTYVELIDVATYLNHYYFISLAAFLLCLLPAHRAFSVDVKLGFTKPLATVPVGYLRAFQLQMALVYFFAGIAKINGDWLLEAMPLRIWLHAKGDLPMIGPWLQQSWVAYLFSWCGMLFDTLVPFFLFWRRSVPWAFAAVVVFHTLTAILFPGIGMFPFIMMSIAVVFLPVEWHQAFWSKLGWRQPSERIVLWMPRWTRLVLVAWFVVQFALPLRHLLYPGSLFYHEEGYRFSWRVMLMEKAGTVFFTLHDPATGKRHAVDNRVYLTKWQEKQMSTQPDLILQFAHYLKEMNSAWLPDAAVHAEAYVTVNGRGSRLFIDSEVDLAQERDGFAEKRWVLDHYQAIR